MSTTALTHQTLLRRKARTRAKLSEQPGLPRLSVHRSLRHIFAQIIDDQNGRTLVAANDLQLKTPGDKSTQAQAVGSKIAELAKEKNIKAVRFDRGSFRYHGRIAALAAAAREAGLKF